MDQAKPEVERKVYWYFKQIKKLDVQAFLTSRIVFNYLKEQFQTLREENKRILGEKTVSRGKFEGGYITNWRMVC